MKTREKVRVVELSRIDIITHIDDDGHEYGFRLDCHGGSSLIPDVLQAIALQDISSLDSADCLREIVAHQRDAYKGLTSISLIDGRSPTRPSNEHRDDQAPEFAYDPSPLGYPPLGYPPLGNPWLESVPPEPATEPAMLHLCLNYETGETTLRATGGDTESDTVLHGSLSPSGARDLGDAYFTEFSQYSQHLPTVMPQYVCANIRVIHSREGATISGLDLHVPMNGPHVLSNTLSWLREGLRRIYVDAAELSSEIATGCAGVDATLEPFYTAAEDYSDDSLSHRNDCPLLVIDWPACELRLHGEDGEVLALDRMDKMGAGSLRKSLHAELKERGLSLKPHYHQRYAWRNNYADYWDYY